MRLIGIVLAVAILAGCASPAPRPARVSDTMWPEAVIPAPREQVRDTLVSRLASNGGAIEQATDVLVQVRLQDPQITMTRLLLSCPACSDPFIRVTFALSERDGGTHVVAQYASIVPKFGGAEQSYTMTRAEDFNRWQGILWSMRDELSN